MQKANGLNLKMCGASYNSLMSGMVLGYSCHPKTIRNYEKALADANKKETKKKIVEATAVRTIQFLIITMSTISLFSKANQKNLLITAIHKTTNLKNDMLVY